MATIRKVLEELVTIEGIQTAVLVGRDGFVIEAADRKGSVDLETVGAVISTGTRSTEQMGQELKIGGLSQSMVEYKDGLVIMSSIGGEAILAAVADSNANLGYVRYQVKRRMGEITSSL